MNQMTTRKRLTIICASLLMVATIGRFGRR